MAVADKLNGVLDRAVLDWAAGISIDQIPALLMFLSARWLSEKSAKDALNVERVADHEPDRAGGYLRSEEPLGQKNADESSRLGREESGVPGVAPASTVGRGRGMDTVPSELAKEKTSEKTLLSVRETAFRFGISVSTLYHKIASGQLNEARGLCRFGSRRLIDWRRFKASLELGELG